MISKTLSGTGFLNLPPWHDRLREFFSLYNHKFLTDRPVLGRESADRPWMTLDSDEFFSVVNTGFHFESDQNLSRVTDNVITSDARFALERIAGGKGCSTGFRGAIGGVSPILDIYHQAAFGSPIKRMIAMVDGTAGHILGEMQSKAVSLDKAIANTQWKGTASANLSRSIHGTDARDRLALLVYHLWGLLPDENSIETASFCNLDLEDVLIAGRLGFSIRQTAIVTDQDGKIDAWVGPCFLPSEFLTAKVRSGTEIAYIQCADGNNFVFSGPGTSPQTVVRCMLRDFQHFSAAGNQDLQAVTPCPVKSTTCAARKYYLRFNIVDFAQTLSALTSVFAEFGVPIHRIYQPERADFDLLRSSAEECNLVVLTDSVDAMIVSRFQSELGSKVRLATLLSCIRYET